MSPDSPHRNYKEDLLLPRQWDGNGFAASRYAPGGFVLRTDADGKEWELMLGGFRNAYDFAFNADGELFTFDADMEWDWGMPWYRPIRVNHCTSAAEFGWRYGTGKWPEYYADSLGAVGKRRRRLADRRHVRDRGEVSGEVSEGVFHVAIGPMAG